MRLEKILQAATHFTKESPLNFVQELDGMQIYDPPLIGVALADDPLFEHLKQPEVIGEQHLSPREWLPQSQIVLSYFLPFTKAVREANRKGSLPATEWLHARRDGEIFNNALRQFLIDLLKSEGYQAIAPGLDARLAVANRKSNWSERHVAFIAGLGTFSLNYSLITKQGAAGRVGSVITDLKLDATPRYYEAIDENCTKCGACIKRCPAHAISQQSKDHASCAAYLDEVFARYQSFFGCCGKCQTDVPCEDKIPEK